MSASACFVRRVRVRASAVGLPHRRPPLSCELVARRLSIFHFRPAALGATLRLFYNSKIPPSTVRNLPNALVASCMPKRDSLPYLDTPATTVGRNHGQQARRLLHPCCVVQLRCKRRKGLRQRAAKDSGLPGECIILHPILCMTNSSESIC